MKGLHFWERVKGVDRRDLTHCSRCPEQTFQERQHVSGQAPPLARSPGPAVRAISNLHTSEIPCWLLCLRTFLKMWVLAPPKVKTEIKQPRRLEGEIKSPGVWRSDPGMPSDKTEKGDGKQTEAGEICSRALRTPDESKR